MASYGPYLVVVPVLSDADLVYTELETKEIFTFFYASMSRQIAVMDVDNQGRAFAQILMIAAVEGSMGMGVVEATFKALFGTAKSKNRSILKLGKKLAEKYTKWWWKHAKMGEKIADIDIYYRVRDSVALALKSPVGAYINGDRDVSANFLKGGVSVHVFG
jgi:hypothetical protein